MQVGNADSPTPDTVRVFPQAIMAKKKLALLSFADQTGFR